MNQGSQMGGRAKKPKRGSISEEDASNILQRYSATTVLALLQEVAQVQDAKIDWNAMVKRTTTGITNPREYQMLWRHLAYRHGLHENVDDEAKPLDDDSDLEYEVEAFPTVSNEASTEAVACVKVLIASGSTCDSGLEKGLAIEAPLTINIPNGKSAGNPLEKSQLGSNMRGTNITVPVFVQKQPLPTVTHTEGGDTNGSASGSLPPRRKRKTWSEAEDMELFAAVQKCGEGNWANILKGDFKGDRTASQLSQRWNIIKKRKGNSNLRTGSQLSEVHLAARRALNMALDQPGVDNLKTASSLGRPKSAMAPSTSMRPIGADMASASTLPQDQSREDTASEIATKMFPKTRPKTSPTSLVNGQDAVKAAAVAAGARIATQSAAATILKQQLKTAIHIKTNVTGNTRSSAGANFRDIHSPSASQPHDHYTNMGAIVQLNQSSIAPETNSANSPKDVQEDQNAILVNAQEDQVDFLSRAPAENGNPSKIEVSVLNRAVNKDPQDTSEDEAKQSEALPITECMIGDDSQPIAMAICKNESLKQSR